MMQWIVGSSLRNRYLVIAAGIALMIFGAIRLSKVPMDVFPEFAPPLVEIQTETPGLSTSEVESFVTIPLEAALNSTPDLDALRSKSVAGISQIVMIFKPDTDPLIARQQVQERLSIATQTLPTWAGMPWILQPLSATSRLMHIGITSDKYSAMDLSMMAYWTIRWRLMAVPGVANVVIWGDHIKQMQVQLDPQKLLKYRIPLDTVLETTSDALDYGLLKFTNAAKTLVGGVLDTPNQRLGIHDILPVLEPSDLAKIPIDNKNKPTGESVTLGDLGQVVWGNLPLIGEGVINGKTGLLLIVEKFPWANTLEVTRGVDNALKEFSQNLSGIEINNDIFRPASFIEIAVKNLTNSLFIACFLVMVVLALFLYEWRTTVISLIAIPLSLIAAGVLLSLWGITFNTMTLAGFVIAIGGVVDDAIIDVENIIRRLRQNRDKNKKESAFNIILHASIEIRGAIIFAVLIDIAVLLPVFFLEGVSGAFFKPLVTAYALALFASMVVALTITPALCYLLLRNKNINQKGSPVLHFLQKKYNHSMSYMVQTKKPVFITIALLIIFGVATLPFLGESLFPEFKESYFLSHWVTEPNTSLDETVRMTKQVSHELKNVPNVLNFGSHIGRAMQGEEIAGVNFAENWISIDPASDYDKTLETIEKIVAGYPGLFHDVQTYLNERIDEVIGGSGYPFTVRIFGPDLVTLRMLAEKIQNNLAQIEGATDVQAELQTEVPQINIEVNMEKANQYGLKPGDIRRIVGSYIAGTEVSDIHRDAKVYDVAVYGKTTDTTSLLSVQNLLISTPAGNAVKLSDVATVSIKPTPNIIERELNSRRIDVRLDTNHKRDMVDIGDDINELIAQMKFPLGYHAEIIGEYQERESAQNLLLSMGIIAAIIVFLLFHAAFKNVRLALLAFLTLPSALVGGLLAAVLTSGVISLGSLIGFFTVFGIAARNGIMLINHYQYIEQHENEPFGPSLVLRGAKERLAPILMTALAAGFALIPLIIFGDIPGQEIEYPMAIVILGGLVTSTLLNLFIVPQLYLRFAKKRRL